MWDLKGVPPSIYREAELRNHQDTVARFSISSVQDEINTLKRVVPTAAAIAMATVNSPALATQMRKAEGPATHKNVSELRIDDQTGASRPGSRT